MEKSFQSKILLFGEYGIIHNAMGLSIPYRAFEGKLTFSPQKLSPEEAEKSNSQLMLFANHLHEMVQQNKLNFALDIERLIEDINKGLVFDSSIPQGFGVGSSGALVAAVYDRYALEKIPRDLAVSSGEIMKLKDSLARMEGYFHGRSSGMDPLICYLNIPLLIGESNQIGPVGLPPEYASGKGAIFLLNTGKPGKTQPLVNLFLEKCKEAGFLQVVRSELIPFSDNCIKAFIKGEMRELFDNVKSLSSVLLSYLNPMIPKKFRKIWKRGLETQTYYLKLCGSGGGGYILGFTEDLDKAMKELGDHQIHVIHRF